MSSTVWFIVAIVSFSLSALLLLIAIFMFIKMNIPAIIGDLSGRTASRQIEEIRNRNASGAEKRYRPSAINIERGKLTDAIAGIDNSISSDTKSGFGKKVNYETNQFGKNSKSGTYALNGDSDATDKLTTMPDVRGNATDVLSNGTDVLSNATDVLSNATDVLCNGTDVLSNATDVLSDGTDVLSNATDVLSNPTDVPGNGTFRIVKDIVVIHTNETIN